MYTYLYVSSSYLKIIRICCTKLRKFYITMDAEDGRWWIGHVISFRSGFARIVAPFSLTVPASVTSSSELNGTPVTHRATSLFYGYFHRDEVWRVNDETWHHHWIQILKWLTEFVKFIHSTFIAYLYMNFLKFILHPLIVIINWY